MQIVRRLQPIFIGVAILLLVMLVWSQWQELSQHEWRLQPGWLSVSAVALAAAWAVEIFVWRRLLSLVGGQLGYWSAARIWFLSAVVRYIPGNIWQPLSMTLLCQQRGVAPEATLTSIILYQISILLAAAPIGAVYFATTGNWGLLVSMQQVGNWLVAISLIPLAIFMIRPSWMIEVINWLLSKFHRPSLRADLTRIQLLQVMGLVIVDWMLWGAAFMALAYALSAYAPAEMIRLAPHLLATYALAYSIGFVSLITPSGIGVREGAFYVLLAPIMGGAAITVLALAMRLWTTAGELVAAGIALLLPDRLPEQAAAHIPVAPVDEANTPHGVAQ
ncbi:MAG: flippase-like domain-containing protein [Anaerolineales bacterium]|nr:flippase-like domain-containing protein [Anaerolineales bacterium]